MMNQTYKIYGSDWIFFLPFSNETKENFIHVQIKDKETSACQITN